jgi:hypothetical protein
MAKEDFAVGVVRRFGGTATKQTVLPAAFDPMFFWADAGILTKFAPRGRVFKGSFAGLGHESTSESTFSEAGRAFSAGRTDIHHRQLSNSIVCNAGEKRRSTPSAEVQVAYKKIKAERVAERAAAAVGVAAEVGAAAAAEVPAAEV